MRRKTIMLGLAVGLACSCLSGLRAADNQSGYESIFNGRDLTGWSGNPKFWSVVDGAITGQTTAENPTPGNTFILWQAGTVDDFELRLSFRMYGQNPEKWANSGIQYRSQHAGNWVVGGYQADMEGGPNYTGILYEERGRGILAQRGEKVTIDPQGKIVKTGTVGNAAEIQASIKSDDWNEYVIIAQGNHLIQKINGQVTVDVTDEQVEKRAFKGILALQLHAGKPMKVQFKDIRLKRLNPVESK